MKEFLEAEKSERAKMAALDPYRLKYHLMPPVGWLNDPNGLCEFKDTYHIFFQYTPEAADGNGHRGWGHYSTKDFHHYKYEGSMLYPDSPLDFGGAYSGSAFEDNGMLHFFYTGNGKHPGNYDYILDGRQHWLCHFTSPDGFHFSEKEVLLKNEDYPENLSCHVRDPKVLQQDGKYYMVQGSRTKDSVGQVNIFESSNLADWKPCSVIQGDSNYGYMWECPDLFKLDGQMILLCCPQGIEQSGNQYESIYQNGWFAVNDNLEKDQTVHDFHEFDKGFDFYAPQTFLDSKGRRILIGWMGMPDEDFTNPTIEKGWQHALTLPRELSWKDGILYQFPIEEILSLKEKTQSFTLQAKEKLELKSPVFTLTLKDLPDSFEIVLRKDISLEYSNGVFTLDMKTSGSGRKVRHLEISDLHQLDIFSDTSSLEIFFNHGQAAMTSRIYDKGSSLKLEADCELSGTLSYMKSFEVEGLEYSADLNKQ